jgi:hypothetical protein
MHNGIIDVQWTIGSLGIYHWPHCQGKQQGAQLFNENFM